LKAQDGVSLGPLAIIVFSAALTAALQWWRADQATMSGLGLIAQF